MLRRDFIMVQIEELSKIVLQIVTNRNTHATKRNPELIRIIYGSLRLDRPTLMTALPEMLVRRLDEDDGGGLLRLEIGAKALIEESYLYPEEEAAVLQRAFALLEYVQRHDNTFSLERASMLDGLRTRMSHMEQARESG